MSTFYVLPPRECLEQATTDFLARMLPGVSVPATLWEELLELIAKRGDERYFIHREDLPGDGELIDDLTAGFGAEPGDGVVVVGLAVGSAPPRVRAWVIPAAVSNPGSER